MAKSHCLRYYFSLLFMAMAFNNCGEIAKESLAWYDSNSIADVEGSYFNLENDGIKVYLPKTFQRYSSSKYEDVLRSKLTPEDADYEMALIRQMKSMEGSFYLYFDEESYATYTVNTVGYIPFNKQDAKYLLGLISMNQQKLKSVTQQNYEKKTAKFNDSNGTQIFKAVYEVTGPKQQSPLYTNAYVISSKGKTAFINLTSAFNVSFDPFIGKTIFR